MAIGRDRVQVLKREHANQGGNAGDDVPYPKEIKPQEDALESAGIFLQDAENRDEAVFIAREGNELVFTTASRSIRLSEIVSVNESTSSGFVMQTKVSKLLADTSITSTSWNSLLSTTITKQFASSRLLVSGVANVSQLSANQGGYVRLLLDSSTAGNGGGFLLSATGWSQSVMVCDVFSGLAAGSHTVALQWRMKSSGRTAQCRPVTLPDGEGATLVIQEVL